MRAASTPTDGRLAFYRWVYSPVRLRAHSAVRGALTVALQQQVRGYRLILPRQDRKLEVDATGGGRNTVDSMYIYAEDPPRSSLVRAASYLDVQIAHR